MSDAKPAHKRILLKLSGEALMGDDQFGINRATIVRMVEEVAEITRLGVEVAVVIGFSAGAWKSEGRNCGIFSRLNWPPLRRGAPLRRADGQHAGLVKAATPRPESTGTWRHLPSFSFACRRTLAPSGSSKPGTLAERLRQACPELVEGLSPNGGARRSRSPSPFTVRPELVEGPGWLPFFRSLVFHGLRQAQPERWCAAIPLTFTVHRSP